MELERWVYLRFCYVLDLYFLVSFFPGIFFPTSLCGVLVFGCALPPGPAPAPARRPPPPPHRQLVTTELVTTQLVHTQLIYSHTTCVHTTCVHTTCPHTHTQLAHTCSHTTCSPHNLSTHNFSPHNLSTHNFTTHNLTTHNLTTHNLLTHNLTTHNLLTELVTTQLVHTQLAHTTCHHTTYSHTTCPHLLTHTTCSPLFTHNLFTHTQLVSTQLAPPTTCPQTTCSQTTSPHTTCPYTTWPWTCILRGRLANWHLWHWAGSGGALGSQLTPWTPQLFSWQAWHLATWTCILRGRRGTYGTGLALVAHLVPSWLRGRCGSSHGKRGTWRHGRAFCVAGVALGDMDVHSAWQAWHYGTGLALVARLVPSWRRGRRGSSRGRLGTCGTVDAAGLCWPSLGLSWPILGAMLAHLGAMLIHLEAYLRPCWAILSHKIRKMGKKENSKIHCKTQDILARTRRGGGAWPDFGPTGWSPAGAAAPLSYAVERNAYGNATPWPDLSAYTRQPARGPTMLAQLVAICWPMLASCWSIWSQKIRKMGTGKKRCKTQDILMVGGLSWGYVGPSWGYVGLSWGQCGPIFGLCWPILGLCWPILALSWPILGAMLPHVGAMLIHLEAYVGPCWPMLSHKGRKMGKNGKSTKHRKTRDFLAAGGVCGKGRRPLFPTERRETPSAVPRPGGPWPDKGLPPPAADPWATVPFGIPKTVQIVVFLKTVHDPTFPDYLEVQINGDFPLEKKTSKVSQHGRTVQTARNLLRP